MLKHVREESGEVAKKETRNKKGTTKLGPKAPEENRLIEDKENLSATRTEKLERVGE